jgi:hypothetical protein
VVAQLTSVTDAVKRLDLTQLTHREVLQAGIQQLNGEWYSALRQATAAAPV